MIFFIIKCFFTFWLIISNAFHLRYNAPEAMSKVNLEEELPRRKQFETNLTLKMKNIQNEPQGISTNL